MNSLWELVTQGVPSSIQKTPEALAAIDPVPTSKPGGLGQVHIQSTARVCVNPTICWDLLLSLGPKIPPLLEGMMVVQGKQLEGCRTVAVRLVRRSLSHQPSFSTPTL